MRVLGFGAGLAGFLFLMSIGVAGSQSTTASKPTSKPKSGTRTTLATWSPDVQQALGVTAADFKTAGLNKLTTAQLQALMNAAKSHPYVDPKKKLLNCPASPLAQGARVQVLLTVSGDDPTGQRAAEIRQAIGSLSSVDLVDALATANRALHVVIQEQTLAKRTIGYTASYVTSTPCVDESGGSGDKQNIVELKGQLGTYTDPKGSDLARDLARMLDQDLQPLRGAGGR
ncbi:MAG TPA: hypothetical protein VF214_03115 [Edaphobacter sp.]